MTPTPPPFCAKDLGYCRTRGILPSRTRALVPIKEHEHHIPVAGAADSPPPTATARDRAWATPNFPRHPFLVSHAAFSAPRTTTGSSERRHCKRHLRRPFSRACREHLRPHPPHSHAENKTRTSINLRNVRGGSFPSPTLPTSASPPPDAIDRRRDEALAVIRCKGRLRENPLRSPWMQAEIQAASLDRSSTAAWTSVSACRARTPLALFVTSFVT
ncbi:hypothetical protein B0H13DRAFT_2332435 [Mycena leptocephala]|nr:hypothetical protein B0H13DRAFT_2332435 [Mycena leptocephala]